MTQSRFFACAFAFVASLLANTAYAHHVTDFLLTSSAPGGGHLECLYAYDITTAPMFFSNSGGGVSVYTGTDPGFDASDGDDPRFGDFGGDLAPVLLPGTQLWVEITAIEEGRTAALLNGKLLAKVGDSVYLGTQGAAPPDGLHHHPAWQLMLMLPEGEYGEGTISFRVTTNSPAYEPSPSYTLRLSNAHLNQVAYGSDTDHRGFACQKTIGEEDAALIASIHQALRYCLDKVQHVRALQETGHNTKRAEAIAERACADHDGRGSDTETLLGKLATARQKAQDQIQSKCGPGSDGSSIFSDAEISEHLGMIECKTFGLIASAYFAAQTDLKAFIARPSQGGKPVSLNFPCFPKTAGEEELNENNR